MVNRMSYVTNFLMHTGEEDAATPKFLEAVGAMRGGVVPDRVPDEGFPGPKYFEGEVYAAAGNYWDLTDMQALLDAAGWDHPEQVVIICCSNLGAAEVYRPSQWPGSTP